MSSKTKTGGWFLDDESAGIGYNPYPKVKRLTEQEKKKLAQLKKEKKA
ncbi:unnamed protein product [marine sediment metagenome]|uniref:Uncharacterized protein n=1 Tax=marine sediment metagenome TaxID=412755 RepID=X1B1X5_9ZZZZ